MSSRQDLANSPPLAESVDVLTDSPDALFGTVEASFSPNVLGARGIERTIVVAPGGEGRVLNDLGLAGDNKAGDGVFTGQIALDESPGAAFKQLSQVAERLNAQSSVVAQFQGRTLLERHKLPERGGFDITPIEDPRFPGRFRLPKLIVPGPFFPLPPLCNEERCLMIRDLSVVADPTRTFDPCDSDGDGDLGDPNGPWSFKTLMTNLANEAVTGTPATFFVHYWLSHWLQNINNSFTNGHTILNRAAGIQAQILSKLPNWDPADPTTLQESDLEKLPFRLLAIANRNDLAGGGYGGTSTGDPGEIRFVFGLLQMQGKTCRPHPSGMSVIFEYKDKTNCFDVSARAREWIALDTDHPAFPSPSYNAALQAITDDVTAANAAPFEPAGSALNQLRTNDIALGSIWELREFRIDPATLRLEPHTLAQTPDASFHTSTVLRDCMNSLSCRANVPASFMGANLLAASQAYGPEFHFDALGVFNPIDRRLFSENTCGGCHGANALDPNVRFGPAGLNLVPPFAAMFASTPESFYHVDARTPGGIPANLSRFLKGTDELAPFSPIPDRTTISPALPAKHFDDLHRRGQILASQSISSTCANLLLGVVHMIEQTRIVPDPFLIEQISLPNVH